MLYRQSYRETVCELEIFGAHSLHFHSYVQLSYIVVLHTYQAEHENHFQMYTIVLTMYMYTRGGGDSSYQRLSVDDLWLTKYTLSFEMFNRCLTFLFTHTELSMLAETITDQCIWITFLLQLNYIEARHAPNALKFGKSTQKFVYFPTDNFVWRISLNI